MECPRELLSLDVPAGARLVLVALWSYASPSRLHVWPSVPTLAADTRQSDRSVRRHLDDLERAGWISRRETHKRGVVVWDLQPLTKPATPDVTVRGHHCPPLPEPARPLTKPARPLTAVSSPSELTKEQTKNTPQNAHAREWVVVEEIAQGLPWIEKPAGLPALLSPRERIRELVARGATAAEVLNVVRGLSAAIEKGDEERQHWNAYYIFSGHYDRLRTLYAASGAAKGSASLGERLEEKARRLGIEVS